MRDTTWLERLGLALRTAMACLIVSLTTLYGPKPLRHFTAFPAFSYLTTILIWLSDAEPTYGEVLKCCLDVSYATFQTIAIVLVSVLVVGPASLGNGLVAPVAVALASFIVAFPVSTSLLTKRIAFGQIVVVYVTFVVFNGEVAHVFMLPAHVAGSTALGAIASLIAVLLPFPRLAHSQMSKGCKLYAENALERLNMFVEIMMARDNTTAQVLLARAASLSAAAKNTLKNIKIHHERMVWERPDTRFLRRKQKLDPGEKLHATEFLMRGLELALGSCSSFPQGMSSDELNRLLEGPRTHIAPRSESTLKSQGNLGWHLEAGSLSTAALPVCFFRYCVELFRGDFLSLRQDSISVNRSNTEEEAHPENEGLSMARKVWDILCVWMARERFVFAFKCSISLGLAVLFGIMYNKKNGYWSGLTVAISLVSGRQATLTVANSRLQGTAMGSVYGLICCSVFQRLEEFRFLPLLPWIILAVFMRHSKVYGQPGGVTAAIAALLILGRRNYGAPTEFAIARIVEASIGLLCFVFGEILVTPARAATIARTELSHCLDALLDCIQSLVLCSEQKNQKTSVVADLRKRQAKLKSHVEALERFTAEALTEPKIPFLCPLNTVSYYKLLGSFSKISDLCLYVCDGLKNLSGVQPTLGFPWDTIAHELRAFQEKLHPTVKCLKEIALTKSQARLQKELQKRKICHDVEAGTTSNEKYSNMELGPSQDDAERFSVSFVMLLKEATDKISDNTAEEVLKSETALCLSSLGFCISRLMQETICIMTEITHTT
ncbi:Para-hydroxybenzoic acid efflux pump subunit AaeB/fusaric acid resistance protein [Arabidopsis suecica]|uniref:Para-hydroxybenzoic acid efflux pump subunit AaeB/fusaric acid resistance protein n=1 Tax=Arabidopsis suecica TaxID=45249 RepID=A0A8T2B1W2_ARASU|nr:Para-hydroxybenzoic acid efflux pump subunit AaeB/fusaric acid resistance protein [Arabidopsis suecica]